MEENSDFGNCFFVSEIRNFRKGRNLARTGGVVYNGGVVWLFAEAQPENIIRKKEMAQNLFVGSLAFATTDETLKTYFEKIGEVASARVATDRESGRSRGFGFVEFTDEANNQKAIDELNGTELDGREITVNLARPKEDRPRGGSRGGNGGGSFRQRSW